MVEVAVSQPLKVVGYCRVSTDEQAKGQSIETQSYYLQEWAKEQGWTYLKSYNDPGYSGGNENRPALQELLKDVDAHLFDAVLFTNTDRASRDADFAFVFYRRIVNNDLRFGVMMLSNHGLIDKEKLMDPMVSSQLRMLAMMDDFFRLLTKKKTKMGMKKLKEEGKHMGRPRAFYTIGDDGKLKLNNEVVMKKILQVLKDSPPPKRGRPYRYYSSIAKALGVPYFSVYNTMKRVENE